MVDFKLKAVEALENTQSQAKFNRLNPDLVKLRVYLLTGLRPNENCFPKV